MKGKLSRSNLAAIITAAVVALVVVALIILNAFIPLRYFSAYMVKAHKLNKGEARVTFFDVGFGDCALAELPDGKTMLIDGGDGSYAVALKILTYLNYRGIDTIDYLVCTSVREEHCAGLAEIVRYKNVGRAYIPYSINTDITDGYSTFYKRLEGVAAEYACASVGIAEEDYFFAFISPVYYTSPTSEYAALNSDPDTKNVGNASAVLWLNCLGVSFAFTSDIRTEGLERICTEYAACKRLGQSFCAVAGAKHPCKITLEDCDIATVCGHGASVSEYAPWYDLIKPSYGIVSVGTGYSDYPSTESLSDVYGVGGTPCITSECGDVTVVLDGDGYTLFKEKL